MGDNITKSNIYYFGVPEGKKKWDWFRIKKEETMVKIPQMWFKNHEHTDQSSANFWEYRSYLGNSWSKILKPKTKKPCNPECRQWERELGVQGNKHSNPCEFLSESMESAGHWKDVFKLLGRGWGGKILTQNAQSCANILKEWMPN